MAEIVLSPLLQVVIQKLASACLQELQLQREVKEELRKLSRTLETIQAVIYDAEEKQVRQEAMKVWLRQLKDVAYKAKDILEDFAHEIALEESQKNEVSNSFAPCFCFKQVIFRHNIASRVKKIRKEIDEISSDRSKFDLREGVVQRQPVTEDLRQTDSFVVESEVCGRKEDKEDIVKMLLNDEGPNNLSIISIIGLGGLGKTTLAQLLFNDESVKKHFEPRIWICVSDNFNVDQLTKSIIESITNTKCDLPNANSMKAHLREMLNGKRFFLVLDDVWSEDAGEWENLKKLLIFGSRGSKVIITSRIEKVVEIMGTNPPYLLKGLSEEDCWTLFKQRAFGRGREPHPNLVAIGKEILKKCGGIPLAAKALGSLMRFKTEEREWLSVRDSEIWHLEKDEKEFLPALKLSYNHLSPHLKQCFAYCSIFPKDYIIKKERLIQLWMANDLIPSKGRMELEDIGNEIFNEFIWRSFFQDIKKDDGGNIIKCKMHDLVHDLARCIMSKECISVEVGMADKVSTSIRHLSLERHIFKSSSIMSEVLCGLEALHTFYLQTHGPRVSFPPYIVKYKCLRVLDLSYTDVRELPISIENLKHLRYLDLSRTDIVVLPESITSLLYLQTLKLFDCQKLCRLPSGMRNMVGLRHLDITECNSLACMPTRIGQLSCLKILTTFIVSNNDGCRIGELKSLNLIRGNLTISRLENVRNGGDAKEANLISKPDVRNLFLIWSPHSGSANSRKNNDKEVLEGLKPHSFIRRFYIYNYGDIKFPYWMGDPSLLNLVEIKLYNCRRLQSLPSLGQLPALKELFIWGLDDVSFVGNELYGDDIATGFPSLEKLSFYRMYALKKWSVAEGRPVFPVLRSLHINDCKMLKRMPPRFPSIETLVIIETNPKLLMFVANLTSLSSLEIRGFKEVSLPKEMLRNLTHLQSLRIYDFPMLRYLSGELDNLTALKDLTIGGCEELESLPQEGLQNLISLEKLRIDSCHSLTSLPGEEAMRGLSSLRTLNIQYCDKLTSLSNELQYLTALEDLSIYDCPKLESLSQSVHHLTALQSLTIKDCPELKALPEMGMRNLTSLRRLEIIRCDKMTSLPDELQYLTALHELDISGSSHLERRYEKETGEDWHKIAHVPRVEINYRDINE